MGFSAFVRSISSKSGKVQRRLNYGAGVRAVAWSRGRYSQNPASEPAGSYASSSAARRSADQRVLSIGPVDRVHQRDQRKPLGGNRVQDRLF